MERPRSGYTIVEVLLFFAISTALLLSTLGLFSRQRGETEFSQAMISLESKIRGYASQVSSGSYSDAAKYSCSLDSNHRPVLTAVDNPVDRSNQDCIFLGRAIRLVPGQSQIYIYTVLGSRDEFDVGGDTGNPATIFSKANPEVAHTGNTPWTAVSEETYNISSGANVISSHISSSPEPYNVIAFYTSLEGLNASGSQSSTPITAQAYAIADSSVNPGVDSDVLKSCIEGNDPCSALGTPPNPPVTFNEWSLCVQNPDNPSLNGLLTVGVTLTGVNTQVKLGGCS